MKKILIFLLFFFSFFSLQQLNAWTWNTIDVQNSWYTLTKTNFSQWFYRWLELRFNWNLIQTYSNFWVLREDIKVISLNTSNNNLYWLSSDNTWYYSAIKNTDFPTWMSSPAISSSDIWDLFFYDDTNSEFYFPRWLNNNQVNIYYGPVSNWEWYYPFWENPPWVLYDHTFADYIIIDNIVYDVSTDLGINFWPNLFFQGWNLWFSFVWINTWEEWTYNFLYRDVTNNWNFINTNLNNPLYTGLAPFQDQIYNFPQTLVPLTDYEVKIIFTPISWTGWVSESALYPFTTWEDEFYNPPVPDPEDWTFFTSWIDFFENWFSLNNFVPNPYWGELSFEIISPSWWTQTTETYWSYETDWSWYGFDSKVIVTYPYHSEAWEYQVRPVYTYNWQSVYPFWASYNSYIISLPEITATPDDLVWWDESVCWGDSADSWFLPWVSNFFSCLWSFITGLLSSIGDAFTSIKSLFDVFWDIGNTTESKTLNQAFLNFLFPSANATQTYEYNSNQDPLAIISQWSFEDIPLLNNIYNFIKWTIIFLILLFIFDYYFNKNKQNG